MAERTAPLHPRATSRVPKDPGIPSPPPLSLTHLALAGRVAPLHPRATSRVPSSPYRRPCPYNDSEPLARPRRHHRRGGDPYGRPGGGTHSLAPYILSAGLPPPRTVQAPHPASTTIHILLLDRASQAPDNDNQESCQGKCSQGKQQISHPEPEHFVADDALQFLAHHRHIVGIAAIETHLRCQDACSDR